MNDDEQPLAEREWTARRLLGWATLLVIVAAAVCALDLTIKRQILDVARDTHDQLGQLRAAAQGRDPGHGRGDSSVADVAVPAAAPADPDQDAGA